jgi:hypothetical protein
MKIWLGVIPNPVVMPAQAGIHARSFVIPRVP